MIRQGPSQLAGDGLFSLANERVRLKMITKYLIIICSLGIVVILGFLSRRRGGRMTPEEYFLAGRRFGPLVLLATMAATNFSGFTIFGASGVGYRHGYSFFPVMGFGTGFMAIMFIFIGRKVWQRGKEKGHITPAELMGDIYRSRPLATLFSLVMIVFTIPYIAIQPIAAGIALEKLLGMPYLWGATLITLFIVIYTITGGMRAIAWTDLFQGTLMLIGMTLAFIVIVNAQGGMITASHKLFEMKPELFSRPGPGGIYTPYIWMSWLILWMLCDPLFPQLFQRFYAARNTRSLSATMICYPAFSTIIFILPIMIGVLGHLAFPNLSKMQSDNILTLLLDRYGGNFVGPLVIACGLAAIMSTMDSQLLTLSSIFVRDILPRSARRATWYRLSGKAMVVILALLGLIIAYQKFDTIFATATKYSFTGLAVLFPTLWGGLYWKRAHPAGAVLSILIGEALVIVSYFGLLPDVKFLPVIPIVGIAGLVYIGVCLIVGKTSPAIHPRKLGRWSPRQWLANGSLAVLFLLSLDFWQWRKALPLIGGLPYWIWYFFLLSALLTLVMVYLSKSLPEEGRGG